VLQAFIKAAMPFWKPGSLTDEDAWAVTAFVLRQNGLWDDRVELTASNADQVPVRATGAESSPVPPAAIHSSDTWLTGVLVIASGMFLLFLLWLFLRFTRSRG
jgi:hypothetical protein